MIIRHKKGALCDRLALRVVYVKARLLGDKYSDTEMKKSEVKFAQICIHCSIKQALFLYNNNKVLVLTGCPSVNVRHSATAATLL